MVVRNFLPRRTTNDERLTTNDCSLYRVHFQRRLEPEAERGLGGKNNLFVARKCGSARTCAAAGERTDRGAFAPAGQAADDRAERGAAARQHRGALALALFRAFDR